MFAADVLQILERERMTQTPWSRRQSIPDPQVREAAAQYEAATQILWLKGPGTGVVYPLLNCAALALELYLKSLSARTIHVAEDDGGALVYAEPERKRHSPGPLFDAVPTDVRKRMEKSYDKQPSTGARRLRDDLSRFDGLYDASRYPFSEGADTSNVPMDLLKRLLDFLKSFVDSFEPEERIEWAPAQERTREEIVYQHTRELHDQIEAVYSAVDRHAAYFRVMSRVDPALESPPGTACGAAHDPFVCALAIKAATTKRAVLKLCDRGDGDNAIALSRMLLENACLLEWLIRGDGRKRLDAYVLFMSVQQVRIAELIDRFRTRPASTNSIPQATLDPLHAAVWKYTFGGTHSDRPTWEVDRRTRRGQAVSVKALFHEITNVSDSFEYKVLYGALGSDVVHSGPSSLLSIRPVLGDTFALRPMPVSERRTLALGASNIAMLLVLDSLTEYIGLDLSRELGDLKAFAQKDPYRITLFAP